MKEHRGMTLDGELLEGKAYIKRVRKSCHRLSCPVCYPSAIKREIARSLPRFEEFMEKHPMMKPIHVVTSVPKSDWELPV